MENRLVIKLFAFEIRLYFLTSFGVYFVSELIIVTSHECNTETEYMFFNSNVVSEYTIENNETKPLYVSQIMWG